MMAACMAGWKRAGMAAPLLALCFLLAVCCLLGGCSDGRAQAARADDEGFGSGHSKAPLPEGWQVYLPDLEFSTVAVYGDHVLAGGLRGLYRYVPESDEWALLSPRDGSFRLVKALAVDASGNLWVGHDQGLTCLPGAVRDGFTTEDALDLGEVDGKPVKAVNTLLVSSDGTLYAGTYEGAVAMSPLAVTGWLAGEGTVGFVRMGTGEGLIHPMVNSLFEDSRGALWFGAYIARGGGVACLHDGRVQHFNHRSGLADDYVTTIAEDSEGAVWVGSGVYTSGGAARFIFEGDRYEAEGMRMLSDGLAGEKVRHIHADKRGWLWFCSEYDGIALFDSSGSRFALLTEESGLPDNEVKAIAANGGGDLWFACRRGLLRMSEQAVERLKPAGADTLTGTDDTE